MGGVTRMSQGQIILPRGFTHRVRSESRPRHDSRPCPLALHRREHTGTPARRRLPLRRRNGQRLAQPPPPLRDRLAAALARGDRDAFGDAVAKELMPRVQAYLRRGFPALCVEDCEDCCWYAVSRFYGRNDDSPVQNPEAYIWQAAKNHAVDMLEERVRAREAFDTSVGESAAPPSFAPAAAVDLVEAVVDDVEVEPGWAERVVRVALGRLRAAHGRVIRHLLERGWSTYDTEDAQEDLGIPPQTFRAYKSLGLKALAELIPLVMTEMNIRPPNQGIVELFVERHVYVDDEEDGNP